MSNLEKEIVTKPMIYQADHTHDVLCEGKYFGFHFVIVSYGTHPCAYVEMTDTQWNFLDYDVLEDKINCHGGLTFAGDLTHIREDLTGWFFGWDYAHAGDYMGYDILFNFKSRYEDKKWTTEEILEDVFNVIEQIRQLEVDLANEEKK